MFFSNVADSPLSLITSGIVAGVSAYLAHKSGRNPYLWFFLGLAFGIFGLLYLSFSRPPRQSQPNGGGQSRRGFKVRREKVDPNTIDITPKYDPAYNKVFWYALKEDRSQDGPMSFDALLRAKREGRINNSTLIWSEQLKEWAPFEELKH